ncbi:Beta-barrel assembly-enhancing protease [Acaryochloris thomasi RCC1774]|uniref:Beta-barrel assembly-enhancing protease n=1 Tax=Acaryochloris thomasi RCC1774 TaxID=1764569 RepID=A0A2W1JBU9_9CYAN|nr:tetratricopeptide repeat protein [Acaryochloris thomasi]PZD71520.1 Beta-barrel assembly-enhancing protease [Acaryochloris thomasi RCC1774]
MTDNSSRTQRQAVQKKQQNKKQRWLIWIFLIIAVVGLAGASFIPVFEELFSNNSSSQPTATPTATVDGQQDGPQKELQDLERSYQIVLEREPENPKVLEALVQTRLQMIALGLKKPADVVEPLTKLAKLSPERTEYQVLLGRSQQQAGDREAASQTFRDILAKDPANVEALQGLVAGLLQEKRPTAAIDILETTLNTAKQANQLTPGTMDELAINLILGQVYVDQQNYDQALTLYDDLIKESPKDFRAFYGKAVALDAQGNKADAQTFFQSAAALAPEQYKEPIKAAAQQTQVTPEPTASPQVPTTPSSSPE